MIIQARGGYYNLFESWYKLKIETCMYTGETSESLLDLGKVLDPAAAAEPQGQKKLVFLKTFKAASRTMESIFLRYGARRGLSFAYLPAGCAAGYAAGCAAGCGAGCAAHTRLPLRASLQNEKALQYIQAGLDSRQPWFEVRRNTSFEIMSFCHCRGLRRGPVA